MRCADRFSGRSLLIIAVVLAAWFAALVPAQAQSYWFETYDRTVSLIDDGQMAEASALLSRVIEDHPYPVACLRIPGDRCIDYLPYYQRARIQFATGKVREAAHSLDISNAFGAALQTRRARAAFNTLRERVRVRTAELATANRDVAPASKSK
jgi:hypothetical protein